MTDSTTRSLSEVEHNIQTNRKALYRAVGGKFDTMSAEAWQWAWDRHPALQARDVALCHEYCAALRQREGRQASKMRSRHQRRQRALAAWRRLILRAGARYQMAA